MNFNINEIPKKYKKDFEHSYALGPFPTFELLNMRSNKALGVYISKRFNEKEKLEALCTAKSIPYVYSDKALNRISDKEICYAAAAFERYQSKLDDTSHIVLVNPSDMGNLGTIIRTVLGFGIKNIAVIEPAADTDNPKTIRASMGAIFRLNIARFKSFEEYADEFGSGRDFFPFMLDGAEVLTPESCPVSKKYSLIFGNESSGLPKEFQSVGKSIFIPQTDDVDSLNLSVSVGIGTYIFTNKNKA